MKKLTTLLALMIVLSCNHVLAGWNTFVIRNSGGGVSPTIQDRTVGGIDGKEFIISAGGMKAAWGTSNLDGKKLQDIVKLAVKDSMMKLGILRVPALP